MGIFDDLGGTHLVRRFEKLGAYDPRLAAEENAMRFQNSINAITAPEPLPSTLPEFDYAQKAAELAQQAGATTVESATNAANNATQNYIAQQQQQMANQQAAFASNPENPRFRAVLRALGQQESGGNFGAVNKDSGALGRWQVMPSNIAGHGGWDLYALGREITPEQFLANPQLQRQIVRKKFGDYFNKYGARGALSAWYSGSPTRWNERTPQGGYPSVRDYVMQVLSRLP